MAEVDESMGVGETEVGGGLEQVAEENLAVLRVAEAG